MDINSYVHRFHGRGELAARRYLPRLATAGIAPPILEWFDGGVRMRRGLPLPEWVDAADRDARVEMRVLLLGLVQALHDAGVCHRDLHWENVVLIDGRPLVIDLEHACEVEPSWPCYDLTGPSPNVSIPPEHARLGGLLGTRGIWWDAPIDPRWGGRYHPLGDLFGRLAP